jgi:hypothetical protein
VIPGIVPRLVTTLGDALPKALLRPVLANMGKKLRRQT